MQESVKDLKADYDAYEAKFFSKVKGFFFFFLSLIFLIGIWFILRVN